jgi:hypothetical protein
VSQFLKYLLSNKSQLKLKEEKPTLKWKESQRPIIIMMIKKMTQEPRVVVTQQEVKAVVLLYCE